ncbi:hypothetical protein V6N12_048537 [Hibiscus sabdariffa]|uniref:Uncharacterized protein n=1 Tax=Hibiscus sabdariffa TaxID=183260 RepID=A0ABR2EL99_9ROSI
MSLLTNSNWFGFQDDTNRPLPEWGEPSDFQFRGSSKNPFLNDGSSDVNLFRNTETVVPSNGKSMLANEDVEFVGVELEGREKAMEQALKEKRVGDAGEHNVGEGMGVELKVLQE